MASNQEDFFKNTYSLPIEDKLISPRQLEGFRVNQLNHNKIYVAYRNLAIHSVGQCKSSKQKLVKTELNWSFRRLDRRINHLFRCI